MFRVARRQAPPGNLPGGPSRESGMVRGSRDPRIVLRGASGVRTLVFRSRRLLLGSASRIAAVLFATLAACGDGGTGPQDVGLRTLSFTDPSRARTIPVDLWYPAAAEASVEPLALSGVFLASAARDAAFAPGAPRSLIVLSHGSGGGRADQAWLAQRLAAAGFLVASVEHPGNRFGDDSPEGVVAVWRRPQDVTFVLDTLLDDPQIGPRIDRRQIGAAGHSSGGYTSLALAGARYDLRLIGAYCASARAGPDCELASAVDFAAIGDVADAGDSYRDERVRAVFAMAPAVGQGFDESALEEIQLPVQIVGSWDDELTLFPLNAAHYAGGIPGAKLTTVQPGGHFVYMSRCNSLGFEVAPLVCTDPDPKTDRAAVHSRVADEAIRFFRESLR